MNSTFRIDTTDFSVDLGDSSNTAEFTVRSFPKNYRVAFFRHISDLLASENFDRVPVIVDVNVYSIFERDFANLRGPIFEVSPIESNKSAETALQIVEFLDTNGVNKGSGALAIGGGIVQDLAGFACGIFKRGVPWSYVPTTLLGQADSCVGGKTGLNFNGKKNVVCSFSAPDSVLICPEFIPTLSEADIRCGLGEMFRLAITGGYEAFERFEAFLNSGKPITIDCIADSLSVKKAVVEFDEYELNERRAMNLGHTIGHAVEAATSHKVPHGVSVAFGIGVEALMARDLLTIPQSDLERIISCARSLISEEDLNNIKEVNSSRLFEALATDKKMIGESLSFALLRGIGNIHFHPVKIQSQFQEVTKKVSEFLTSFED